MTCSNDVERGGAGVRARAEERERASTDGRAAAGGERGGAGDKGAERAARQLVDVALREPVRPRVGRAEPPPAAAVAEGIHVGERSLREAAVHQRARAAAGAEDKLPAGRGGGGAHVRVGVEGPVAKEGPWGARGGWGREEEVVLGYFPPEADRMRRGRAAGARRGPRGGEAARRGCAGAPPLAGPG